MPNKRIWANGPNGPANPGYYLVPEYSPVAPDPDYPGFFTIGA
jgi:hypothetical protein